MLIRLLLCAARADNLAPGLEDTEVRIYRRDVANGRTVLVSTHSFDRTAGHRVTPAARRPRCDAPTPGA
jgi:hypothetical protein